MDNFHVNLFRKFKDEKGQTCEVYAPVSNKVIELKKSDYKIHEDSK